MYECERCGCYCDAGELRGGVCEDCRAREQEEELKMETRRKVFSRQYSEQPDGQMVMV